MNAMSKLRPQQVDDWTYPTRHPTPGEIHLSILRALKADIEAHPVHGPVPFMPVRILRLVEDAITRACDAKGVGL